jgi:3-oxoacyl-[acyl-carrier protein] reductase
MDKKIALVTGANKGIGAAICKQLSQDGYFVYINSRSRDKAEQLLDEITALGGEGQIIVFDVTSYEQVGAALSEFKYDKLDILVNNAGTLRDNLIYQIEVEDWDLVLNTNYFGSLDVYNAFFEKLNKSKEAVVINLCSISGLRPRKGQLPYAVSKAMLIDWTKCMGSEKNETDIKYYAISPGPVATELIKKTKWYQNANSVKRIPLGRCAEVTEIAEFISMLVKNRDTFKNGSNFVLDGGFIQTTKEAEE